MADTLHKTEQNRTRYTLADQRTRPLDSPKLHRCHGGTSHATILNRYEVYRGQEGKTLELYDTVRERDIVDNSEMIIPMPAKGSHGLRVRVRN